MLERTKPLASGIWKRFRSYSLFVQLLLVVPILCAMALTLLVGNLGLALMGTAIPEAAVRRVMQHNSGETWQHYGMTLPLAAPKFSPGLT